MLKDALDPKTKIYHLSDEHQRQRMEDEIQQQYLREWHSNHPRKWYEALWVIVAVLGLCLFVKSCYVPHPPALAVHGVQPQKGV